MSTQVLTFSLSTVESPFKICVLAETEPHENNPECCPQHLEEELKYVLIRSYCVN